MATKRELCNACGRKKPVEHHHSINTGLANAIVTIYQKSRSSPVKLSDLRLTRNQLDNFQKLKYWGLVAPYVTQENNRKRGWWVMTELGRSFVERKAKIPKTVWTFNDTLVRFEGEEVFIDEIVEGYKYRGDYADEARVPEHAA